MRRHIIFIVSLFKLTIIVHAQLCTEFKTLNQTWHGFCGFLSNKECKERKDQIPECVCRSGFQDDGTGICKADTCNSLKDGGNQTWSEYCQSKGAGTICFAYLGQRPMCICTEGFVPTEHACRPQKCGEKKTPNESWNDFCDAWPEKECKESKDQLPRCICRSGFQDDGTGNCKASLTCDDIKEGSVTWKQFCNGIPNAECTSDTTANPDCGCKIGFKDNEAGACVAQVCGEEKDDNGDTWHIYCEKLNKKGCIENPLLGPTCNDCKDGYQEVSSQVCIDIDECESGHHSCKEEVSICRNIEGDYVCDCKESYRHDPINTTDKTKMKECFKICSFVSCPNGSLCRETGGMNYECTATCEDGSPGPDCNSSKEKNKVYCFPLFKRPKANLTGKCYGAEPGYKCSLTCAEGFIPKPAKELLCKEDGQWEGFQGFQGFLRCEAIPFFTHCPDIEHTYDNYQMGNCKYAAPGDKCTYECRDKYIPEEQQILTCSEEGMWTPTLRICTENPLYKRCPSVERTWKHNMSGKCDLAYTGDECIVECSIYFMSAMEVFKCTENGTWNSSLPVCKEARCPNIYSSSLLVLDGTCEKAEIGKTCYFTCKNGFRLEGKPMLVCQRNGSWDGAIPTCKGITYYSCPELHYPENGYMSGNCRNAQSGHTCSFACNQGFRIQGQRTLYCLHDGAWSSPPPICQAIACPDLWFPSHWVLTGKCTNAVPNSRCFFSCQPGSQLTGRSMLTCGEDGKWDYPPPTCSDFQPCPELMKPRHGHKRGVCSNAGASAICYFSCARGYKLVGEPKLICLSNSAWNYTPPKCTEFNVHRPVNY